MRTLSALWRRLDTPGHDACRFLHTASGCELHGVAVFLDKGRPARLAYNLDCDETWRTRAGTVTGFLGDDPVHLTIQRASSGAWSINGQPARGLEELVHLDFGFTPATNYSQLRQLDLDHGAAADLMVAWIDAPPGGLQRLPQRYERRGPTTYWYESPSANYAALLELTPAGIIRRYPGLWELED